MDPLHTANLILDRRIKGHLPVTRFAVSDSGGVMVAVPDEMRSRLYHLVRLTPGGDLEEIGTFSVEILAHIDFAQDGRAFVAATDDDVYVFRDEKKSRFFPDRRDNYISASISANGDLFAVGSADMILSSYSVTLARTSGGVVWTKDLPVSITDARIAPDGSCILIGSIEGTAMMLDNARNVIWRLDGDDSITEVAVSEGDISILGTKGGALIAVGPMGNKLWEQVGEGPVVACALSGDGKLIAAGRTTSAGDGVVEFYDSEGIPVLEHGPLPKVVSVACSTDGRYAALSCEDGTLQVMEITLAPARARSADMVASLFSEGVAALESGDYQDAMQKLTRVLELLPCHVDACRKLVEARDAFVRTRIEEAGRLASEGALARSLEELQAAAEICPYDRVVFAKLVMTRERLISETLESALSLADDGRLDEALEKTEDAIRLDSANVSARELLGRIEEALVSKYTADATSALDSGQAAKAVQALEKAASLRPSAEIRELLSRARASQAFDEGIALYEAKRYAQALFQFKKVLSIDPANSEAARHIEYCESLRQDDTLFDRFSKIE